MRILLVGEYSGFHNSLKYGLTQIGHEVTIIGDGDGFKKFPVDINIGTDFFSSSWILQKIRVAWYKITGTDLQDKMVYSRFRESEITTNQYDIIQFINSNALGCGAKMERKVITRLLDKDAKFYLTACGDDYPYAYYLKNDHKGYSIINPEPNLPEKKQDLAYTLKYLKANYIDNYNLIKNKCESIIPSHIDYKMALDNEPKATDLVPCAVKTHLLPLTQNHDTSVIHIFMGINRSNYDKKGIVYFEKALEVIKKKYSNTVHITIAENLPYNEYITSYSKAHILLDQVLSYDQGYNALEAMAQGKLVFAGAGNEFLKHYNLDKAPLIDARPDVDYLVNQLSSLIEQPSRILQLGKEARTFIKKHHEAILIAKKYEEIYLNIG